MTHRDGWARPGNVPVESECVARARGLLAWSASTPTWQSALSHSKSQVRGVVVESLELRLVARDPDGMVEVCERGLVVTQAAPRVASSWGEAQGGVRPRRRCSMTLPFRPGVLNRGSSARHPGEQSGTLRGNAAR